MQYICGPNWDRRIISINQKGKVGILMSGGVDSWVLHNMLTDPIIFNIVRADGFDSAERVRNLTGKPVIEIPELTTDHWHRFNVGIEDILKNYDVDQLYDGTNLNPPIDMFPEFNILSKPHRPWRINVPRYETPFLHLHKYHIIDLAKQLQIPLENTRSCIDNASGDECGQCWQCKEKKWGFQQLSS